MGKENKAFCASCTDGKEQVLRHRADGLALLPQIAGVRKGPFLLFQAEGLCSGSDTHRTLQGFSLQNSG